MYLMINWTEPNSETQNIETVERIGTFSTYKECTRMKSKLKGAHYAAKGYDPVFEQYWCFAVPKE